MRLLLLTFLLLPLAACKTTNNEPMPQPPADTTGTTTPERPGRIDPNAPIEVHGTLTAEGVECQALRATDLEAPVDTNAIAAGEAARRLRHRSLISHSSESLTAHAPSRFERRCRRSRKV